MDFKPTPCVLMLAAAILLLPFQLTCQKPSDPLFPADCGKRAKAGLRVIGGKNALGRWPWQVIIEEYYQSVGFWYSSSGSLINDQWILTCSHCIAGGNTSKFRVILGRSRMNKKQKTERIYNVSEIRLHPNFTVGPSLVNDIGLLKLSKKVVFDNFIRPICLPKANEREVVGTKCAVTGWGYITLGNDPKPKGADFLQEVNLPVADFESCKDGTVNKSQICVGDGGKTNRTACFGDSGGPLNCKQGDRYVATGVAFSVTEPQCDVKKVAGYSQYTRVSVYIDWIKEQMTTPLNTSYPVCEDNHWACCKFAESVYCNMSTSFGYNLKYQYCPITCHNPDC